MGRYLFRRQIIICFFLYSILSIITLWSALPIFSESSTYAGNALTLPRIVKTAPSAIKDYPLHKNNANSNTTAHLPPKQNHVGPEVFSVDISLNKTIISFKERLLNSSYFYKLKSIIKRGRPYFKYIRRQLEKKGLPPELVYLPILESGFNQNAVSRSGAVGLWQFMPQTSREYGLRINKWQDERRNFMASTNAAIDFIKTYYRHYQNWELTLAAYNCGIGRLDRIINKSGINDYWKLREKNLLPSETAAYVPQFYSIVWVAEYFGRHGGDLDWTPLTEWQSIELNYPIDIRIFARKTGISFSKLYAANADLYYYITPPLIKNYSLAIPSSYTQKAKEIISNSENRLINFSLYTIKSGDTLYALSRHYKVSVSLIRKFNPGLSPSRLRIGSTLVIPMLKDNIAPYPGKNRTAGVSNTKRDPQFNTTYKVSKGDSLWSISRSYRISVEQLAQANNLTVHGTIYAGMSLNVPEKPERGNSL